MSLKNTVKTNSKASPKEMEDLLTKVGLKETTSEVSPLTTEQVDKTVKINVLLSESDHTLYKLHCKINRINMQDKAKEFILDWLSKQPKLGI